MTDAGQLALEIKQASEFVAAQATLGSGIDINALRRAQAVTLITKLRNLPNLELQDATRLTTAVANGGWAPTETRSLADAISAAQQAAASGVQAGKNHPINQKCNTVEFSLTEKEWDQIDDPSTPMTQKIEVVCHRMNRVGAKFLSEQAKGRLAQVLRFRGTLNSEVMESKEWKKAFRQGESCAGKDPKKHLGPRVDR